MLSARVTAADKIVSTEFSVGENRSLFAYVSSSTAGSRDSICVYQTYVKLSAVWQQYTITAHTFICTYIKKIPTVGNMTAVLDRVWTCTQLTTILTGSTDSIPSSKRLCGVTA